MKFETIIHRLLQAAFIAYQAGGKEEEILQAVEEEKEKISDDRSPTSSWGDEKNPCRFGSAQFIDRSEGPVLTICFGMGKLETLSDICAAGIIRLRSNHRAVALKANVLARPAEDHFALTFSEGTTAEEREQSVHTGYSKPTPPFVLGDLSATDQAFVYLAARGTLPHDQILIELATAAFPVVDGARPVLRQYERQLMEAIFTKQAA